MVDISDLFVLHCLKLLLEVLVRHNLVVTPQRLDYLLPVLVNNDGLAEVASTFICKLVHSNRVRACLVADRNMSASALSLFQVNQIACLAAFVHVSTVDFDCSLICPQRKRGLSSPAAHGRRWVDLHGAELRRLNIFRPLVILVLHAHSSLLWLCIQSADCIRLNSTRLILHDHSGFVVHLTRTFAGTLEGGDLLMLVLLAGLSVHALLRRQLRVCVAGALEGHLASLDGDYGVNDILERALVIFAVIVAHLVGHSVPLLQAHPNSTLLPLLHLALTPDVLLSLSRWRALSHLDPSNATRRDSRVVCTLRGDALLRVRVLQNMRLCVFVAPT